MGLLVGIVVHRQGVGPFVVVVEIGSAPLVQYAVIRSTNSHEEPVLWFHRPMALHAEAVHGRHVSGYDVTRAIAEFHVFRP